MREGQHVVVDHGQRGVPPQQGSSWSDVQSCQLRGHVHRWVQTIKNAGLNEYRSKVFNEFFNIIEFEFFNEFRQVEFVSSIRLRRRKSFSVLLNK